MPIAKYKKDKSSGLYYAYAPTGLFKDDGTPEYKKIRAKTIAALDEKLSEFNQNNALGLELSNITVDGWKKQWLEIYKASCRENTRNNYTNLYAKHIQPVIGAMRLNQVRQVHCAKVLSQMSESHSESTVKNVRKIMWSLFDTAAANNLIVVNPAAHLKAAGKPKTERRALSAAERAKCLQAINTHRFGTFFAFAYFFGLRRGELLALTGNDIKSDYITVNKQYTYPDNNVPVLSPPKSEKGTREVPIPLKSRKYIDFGALPSGLLFCRPNGEPYSYSEAVDRINSFLNETFGEDTDLTLHCLRHNYCTMLFEKGVDLQTAREIMGHESIETTLKIYTHYTESLKKKGTSKILKIG